MKTYKLVVTGPFNAGKTEFVRAASDIDIVTTERRISDPGVVRDGKEETTVAMDYGQMRMSDCILHLYGTPGQARFEFMWPILSREMDAFIVVMDSTDRASWIDVTPLIRTFRKYTKAPYVVVANKQDAPSAQAPEAIRKALSLADNIPVLPCVALQKASVLNILKQVRQLLN